MTKKIAFFAFFLEKLHLHVAPSLEIAREVPKHGLTTSLGCWLICEKDRRSRGLHKVEKNDFFWSQVDFLIKLLKMLKKNNTFSGPILRNLTHRKVAFPQLEQFL